MNPVELAFPAVMILLFLEVFFDAARARKYYRLNDTISGLSTGILFLLLGVPTLAGALIVYDLVHAHFSFQVLFGAPAWLLSNPFSSSSAFPYIGVEWASLVAWAFVIVLVDFTYYWFHRAAHEVNFLWATHVAHHSSEEFNLMVSMRGGALQRVFEYGFYLWLAVIGIPWFAFLIGHRIMKLYQFWVHTPVLGKLGFLEAFMVTPSNHRVHHGREAKYIDRNHGGIFIVWDRMFGTYAEEEETPNYGITKPVNSFNPFIINLHVWVDIFRDAFRTSSWSNRFKLFFGRPGYHPDDLGPAPEPVYGPSPKFNTAVPRRVLVYIVVQFITLIVLGLTLWKLMYISPMPWFRVVLLIGFLSIALTSVCGLLENSNWAFSMEMARHAALLILAPIVLHLGIISRPTFFVMIGVPQISALWLFVIRSAVHVEQTPAREK